MLLFVPMMAPLLFVLWMDLTSHPSMSWPTHLNGSRQLNTVLTAIILQLALMIPIFTFTMSMTITTLLENVKSTMQLSLAWIGVKIVATLDLFATDTSFCSSWFHPAVKTLRELQTQRVPFGLHSIVSLAGVSTEFSQERLMAPILMESTWMRLRA